MQECPAPPESCKICGSAVVVVSVNDIGACSEHIDDVFEGAAIPLTMLLLAAAEAFGPEEDTDAP